MKSTDSQYNFRLLDNRALTLQFVLQLTNYFNWRRSCNFKSLFSTTSFRATRNERESKKCLFYTFSFSMTKILFPPKIYEISIIFIKFLLRFGHAISKIYQLKISLLEVGITIDGMKQLSFSAHSSRSPLVSETNEKTL